MTGIGFGTINIHQHPSLAKAVRIHSVPEIAVVVDGRVFHHKEGVHKFSSIVNFIRNTFPYEIVTILRHQNYFDSFVNSWEENKVRVIYFGKQEKPKLRYLAVAFEYRDFAKFMYATIGHPDAEEIRMRYSVLANSETMLIFKEDVIQPAASLSMQDDIPKQSMHDFIDSNKLLILPRISSALHFETLCPVEPVWSRRRICVILVVRQQTNDLVDRDALRECVSRGEIKSDHVRFAYIFRDSQAEFVNSLIQKGDHLNTTVANVVILWRPSEEKIKYK